MKRQFESNNHHLLDVGAGVTVGRDNHSVGSERDTITVMRNPTGDVALLMVRLVLGFNAYIAPKRNPRAGREGATV